MERALADSATAEMQQQKEELALEFVGCVCDGLIFYLDLTQITRQ
jgi:hypothetical protein